MTQTLLIPQEFNVISQSCLTHLIWCKVSVFLWDFSHNPVLNYWMTIKISSHFPEFLIFWL